MDAAILGVIVPAAVALGGGVGWWLGRKRQAAQDAVDTLKEKKTLLEEMLSGATGTDREQSVRVQLDDVNHALLGLLAQRLRRAIRDAGLPAEEMLIANGRAQLAPEQAALIEEAAAEVAALPPPLPVELMFALGSTYYYAKRYEDAKGVFDRIIDLTPDNPVVLNNRGVTYAHMEKYDDALADYNHSLELRPEHPSTLTNRGATYDNMGRYDEALADFNRSLELKPDYAGTLSNRGATYAHMGRYDDALADYNHSLELKPEHPNTLYNMACLFSLWEKKEDALVYLKKAFVGDDKYREMALTDSDFDNIRDDPGFNKLVGPD
jgi:Flp pilus assembly protein TadD